MKDIKWNDTNWNHANDGNKDLRRKFPNCAECGKPLIKGAEVMAISNPYYTKEIIGFVCSDTCFEVYNFIYICKNCGEEFDDTCFEVYKPKYMERFGL